MIVADDAGSAGDEFDRCDRSADLTCFRAANVVLRFEGMDAADRARISGAVSAFAFGRVAASSARRRSRTVATITATRTTAAGTTYGSQWPA